MNILPKTRSLVIGIIIVVAVAILGIPLWRHFESAHGHDHGSAALSLDHGKRWATDAPLRAGLLEIRTAALPVLAAFPRQQLTREQARAFSDSVTSSFATMAKACKLPPQADATLHALIVELLRGAGLLTENPRSQEGFALITKVLRQYPEYFDDPGWTPLPGAQT